MAYHGVGGGAGAQGEQGQRLAVRQAEFELDQLLLVGASLPHRRRQNGLKPLQIYMTGSDLTSLKFSVLGCIQCSSVCFSELMNS